MCANSQKIRLFAQAFNVHTRQHFISTSHHLYQQHALEKSFPCLHPVKCRACTVNVFWEIKWISSSLILLASSPQRARSPRVPASVCQCLEASNNCSSPPPSLFVSYRGSAQSLLPIPLCPEGITSNGLNAIPLEQHRLQSWKALSLIVIAENSSHIRATVAVSKKVFWTERWL